MPFLHVLETPRLGGEARPIGCALAMRVMQSPLYQQLDEAERADCDELVRQNLDWFKRDNARGVAVASHQVIPPAFPDDSGS